MNPCNREINMKKRVNLRFIFLFFWLFIVTDKVYAIEPFDNVPAPQGWYFVAYPTYYSSQKLIDKDGNTAINNLDLHFSQNLFRLAYYDKTTFENTWVFSFGIPVGRIEILNDSDAGIGDIITAVGYILIENQASKTWLGIFGNMDIGM